MNSAVLTGVGAGFGRVLAKTFYRAGYNLVLSDIDYDAASQLAVELDPTGDRSFAARLDIRSEQEYQRVLEQAVERWGSVEVLINNAAVTKARPLLEIESAEFNEVMATNAGGVFTGCRVFGRYFKSRGFGRIVNLASLAGQNGGTATGAHYAASKGAILTLTKIFARELASFGVTVNAVAPGPMDTPLVHTLIPPEKMTALLENIPVHQLIHPEFVASVILLLAAPEAATVSGACWDVNGGLFMR